MDLAALLGNSAQGRRQFHTSGSVQTDGQLLRNGLCRECRRGGGRRPPAVWLVPLLVALPWFHAAAQEPRIPERLWVCEGRDLGTCGTWTFTGTEGTGLWDNGAQGELVVQQYDPGWIIVRRSDTAGVSPGLTAIYRGKLSGDRIEGTVTWTWLGHWTAQVEGKSVATLHEPGPGESAARAARGAAVGGEDAAPQAPPVRPAGEGPEGEMVPAGVPAVMHWCALHCMTLTWKGDHYTTAADPGSSIWRVESFGPESVVLQRTDYGRFPGTATVTGRISPQGDTIVDGTITWTYHPCCGLGSAKFSAAWGAALDSVAGSDLERARRLQPSAEVQTAVCKARSTRVAMQSIASRAIHDPSGWVLRFLVNAAMDVDVREEAPILVDSKVAADDAGWTIDDPGAFVCVGLFLHGDAHFDVGPDADIAAGLSAVAMSALMAAHPPLYQWFRVKPLGKGRYKLTLVPIGIQLALDYSTELSVPAR